MKIGTVIFWKIFRKKKRIPIIWFDLSNSEKNYFCFVFEYLDQKVIQKISQAVSVLFICLKQYLHIFFMKRAFTFITPFSFDVEIFIFHLILFYLLLFNLLCFCNLPASYVIFFCYISSFMIIVTTYFLTCIS